MTFRKPEWIRFKTPAGAGYLKVRSILHDLNLHAVCVEARCPNAGECFAQSTAAFMIMGNVCTRDCLYCSVVNGIPFPPDLEEPVRVAQAVFELGLDYAVITSVTRDDLYDGGASIFAGVVREIRLKNPDCKVELLIPDFNGKYEKAIDVIAGVSPYIINHNIETVREFFTLLRPSGDYDRSIKILKYAASQSLTVKSGIMVGFGETMDNIKYTLSELIEAGCKILTVGQYLTPVKGGYKVMRYYHPDDFNLIKETAINMGFTHVLSAPNVRSSYHAGMI